MEDVCSTSFANTNDVEEANATSAILKHVNCARIPETMAQLSRYAKRVDNIGVLLANTLKRVIALRSQLRRREVIASCTFWLISQVTNPGDD